MLRIARRDLEAIYEQAWGEHPAECCGVLTAVPGSDLSRVHPCRNIQDQLHAEDPAQYPRDSRLAYFIDPGEQYRITRAAEREGGQVAGFYHSHIDCDAYFSQEDVERTMVWGEPAYPEAVYLVVSVHGDGVRGHKAFLWSEATRGYAEAAVDVVG